MIYKDININNIFLFLLSISTWYTAYKNIKMLEYQHETTNDWVSAKITRLEKELADSKKDMIFLSNIIQKLDQQIYKLECVIDNSRNNNISDSFLTQKLTIINPDIFYKEKSNYYYDVCVAPYVLQTTDSSQDKERTPTADESDWTHLSFTL